MKKILVMAFAAFSFVACNNADGDKTTVENKETTETKTYSAVDGDVKYTGNKVMVMKNGSWVEADDDVRMDNNVVVYRDGRVERDDVEIRLRDGEIVNRTGEFFDNTGNAIANAWDVTKEGAKDAGRAIKKTGKKIVNEIDSAIDHDDDKKH